MKLKFNSLSLLTLFQIVFLLCFSAIAQDNLDSRIEEILSKMTLDEKIGQLVQIVGGDGYNEELIRDGKVGSILFGDDGPDEVNRIQRICC